ncbi:hypothetical protein N0V82_008921 [Gnomoniopsis sp. IMI 355080]|nr:hypothetical protein N0V82_008921 [Gnomoniopsis sp. IMI 355080]
MATPRTPGLLPDLPSIAALFLIDFDVKAGYTIIWKRAVPGLELEGVVEYKSLPSGLHTVSNDLIYFVHEEGYAGLSAFVNASTTDEESRRARMIAVGVLVPLSYGRLGRAWRHAEGLKTMAAKLAVDGKQTRLLEEYWEKCGTRDPSRQPDPIKDSPMASPALGKRLIPKNGHARDRSASEAPGLMQPEHRLSPHHPAWSLNNLLETFGPLIFPIHRAALLRKRILISAHAPVNEICNFVYNISILANVPSSVFDLLEPSAPTQRLRPLFTIGVHDIPFLMADGASKRPGPGPQQHPSPLGDASSGWIACTTDSILAIKDDLWDVLITMPPPHAANAEEKVWPTVESPKGVPMKATQRDLRRFRTLKAGLRRLSAATSSAVADDEEQQHQQGTTNSSNSRPTPPSHRMSISSFRTHFLDEDDDTQQLADADEKIIEPTTWAALAYSGFMWWASAGEQRRSDEAEETAHDNGLLADLIPANPTPAVPQRRQSGSFNVTGITSANGMGDSVTSLTARRATAADGTVVGAEEEDEDEARRELGIITYFHRLTSGILGTLAEVVASQEEEYSDVEVSRPQSEDQVEGSEQLLAQTDRSDDQDFSAQVRVDSEALAAMGLDVWSNADAEFVRGVVTRYFNRRARVEGKGVEVCGLRVC